MDPYTGHHVLGIFLTGGLSNTKPSLSLGGVVSTKEYRELRPVISNPISGLQILQVFTANGEGDASLEVDASNSLVFTPPGEDAGTAVAIAVGETKIISGVDTNKAVMVKRFTNDQVFAGKMTMSFVECFNGMISMSDIDNSRRVSGKTCYRCFALKNHSALDIYDLQIWVDPVAGLQSTYSLAKEDIGSDGEVQIIADESSVPSGVVFQEVMGWRESLIVTESDDLFEAGDSIAIWVKKAFPAGGTVDADEEVTLRIRFSVEA